MKLLSINYLIEQKTNIGESIITINDKPGGIEVSIKGEINGLLWAKYFINRDDILMVESSTVDRGYGPTLYDILLEVAGAKGLWVIADRHSISDAAYKVWQFYYFNRPDVEKTELPPGLWYLGRHAEKWLEQMTEDKSTWPDKSEPIWSLWCAYQKSEPAIINQLRDKIKLVGDSVL